MTDDELLIECKKGLNIPIDSTDFNPILKQKLLAVKMFMIQGGVSEDKFTNELGANPLAVGVLVMGVTDLWELKSGEVKFSPLFFTLVTQLAMG